MRTVRIAGVVRQSIVDGTGLRLTVFAQGCPHRCEGCHNPHTHDFGGGYDCAVEKLLGELDRNPLLRGITLSGGEPLCRARELLPLARGARARGRDVWCYTGYTFEQLAAMAREDTALAELLGCIDVLVDGPYEAARRDLTLRFRGSANQRILDLGKSLAAGEAVPMDLPD